MFSDKQGVTVIGKKSNAETMGVRGQFRIEWGEIQQKLGLQLANMR